MKNIAEVVDKRRQRNIRLKNSIESELMPLMIQAKILDRDAKKEREFYLSVEKCSEQEATLKMNHYLQTRNGPELVAKILALKNDAESENSSYQHFMEVYIRSDNLRLGCQ